MTVIFNQDYLKEHHSQLNPGFMVGQLCAIKNLNSEYVAANQPVAEWFGWQLDNMIEQKITDFQIKADAAECSELFVFEDKLVINAGQAIQTIGRVKYRGTDKIIFTEKGPIKNNVNEVIGLYISCFDLSRTPIINMHAILNLVSKKEMVNGQFSLIIKDSYPDVPLSARQNQCLFYLLRGHSCAQISSLLNLSVRTIEGYLEFIKNKMNCDNKQQIIEKAICNGLLSIVPKSMFDQ